MAEWKKTKLLIWGTTYPEFSKKYYETVCTGAVDEATGKLVRIYPITLRHLEKRFRHYNWIEAKIQRNPSDRRPESFRIQQHGIEIAAWLDPKKKDGWSRRRDWVLRDDNLAPSVEALREAQERDRTSLRLVKVKEFQRVTVRRLTDEDREEWDQHREAALKQKDLFVDAESETKDLAFMPVRYVLHFRCYGDPCKGHKMQILDWPTYALSRKEFARKGKQKAEESVKAKIASTLDATKREPYVFLGNTLAHPTSFMVVGFFCPPLPKPDKPKKSKTPPGQTKLF